MPTEADTCRKFVVPKLQAAGWDNEPYSIAEQRIITDGRIVPVGKGFIRRAPKRVDYLLRYRRDFVLAVVEAKPEYKTAADGLQQAKQYAEMLDLKFAYASNGPDILEFDYFTGVEKALTGYPAPEELWRRYRAGKELKNDVEVDQLLTPINFALRQGERYYQESRSIALLKRLLLASAAFFLRWRPEQVRRRLHFRSAGSFGTLGGIKLVCIAVPKFSTSPIAIFSSMIRRIKSLHSLAMRAQRLSTATQSRAARFTSQSIKRWQRTNVGPVYTKNIRLISSI